MKNQNQLAEPVVIIHMEGGQVARIVSNQVVRVVVLDGDTGNAGEEDADRLLNLGGSQYYVTDAHLVDLYQKSDQGEYGVSSYYCSSMIEAVEAMPSHKKTLSNVVGAHVGEMPGRAFAAVPDVKALVDAAVEAGAGIYSIECSALGVSSDESPFAQAAVHIKNVASFSGDDIDIDDRVVVNRGTNGAFVSAWLYVRNEDAGIPDVVDQLMLDLVDHLEGIDLTSAALETQVSAEQISFVSDLFDSCENQKILSNLVGTASDEVLSRLVFNGVRQEKPLSQVVKEVVELGAQTGFPPLLVETIELWLEEYGDGMDSALAVQQY